MLRMKVFSLWKDRQTCPGLPTGGKLITRALTAFVAVGAALLAAPFASESFTAAGTITAARSSHTATLLSSGKVLIAGGFNGGYLNTAEIYDPAA
jgi:hypothetical protein